MVDSALSKPETGNGTHAESPDPAPSDLVPVALEAGWTMALLCGPLEASSFARTLPTEHELPTERRIQLELARLESLLERIKTGLPDSKVTIPAMVIEWREEKVRASEELVECLAPLHFQLLVAFAGTARDIETAYLLGRSLRRSVAPAEPSTDATRPTDNLLKRFSSGRINKLQNWLHALGPSLPAGQAAVVSISLEWWSYLLRAAFDPQVPGSLKRKNKDRAVETLHVALLEQGDAWLALLLGTGKAMDALTPEGYARAAEIAIARASRIAWKALTRYWPFFVVLLMAFGGISYLALAVLPNTMAKVFTEVGAVAAALGITGKSVTSTIGHLLQKGMSGIYECSESDAKAWAITDLPRIQLTHGAVTALRRSGVPGGYRTGPVAQLAEKARSGALGIGGEAGAGDLMSAHPYTAPPPETYC